MKNKKQNEELQNRREFFKNAAKKALPIIGAVALASSPIFAKSTDSQGEPMGCDFGCMSSCYGSCYGGCKNGCQQSCYGSCSNTCYRQCLQSCHGGCSGMSRF